MSKQYLVVFNGNFETAQVVNTRKEGNAVIDDWAKSNSGTAEIYKQTEPTLVKRFIVQNQASTEVKSA